MKQNQDKRVEITTNIAAQLITYLIKQKKEINYQIVSNNLRA